MRRRKFLSGLSGTVATWPLLAGVVSARAQTPGRTYRLGHLGNSPLSQAFDRQITLPELARLGFVEGRNLVFDGRIGLQPEVLPMLMGELLEGKPDAVIAVGPAAVAAASAATRTTPIISFGADPIALGLAQSYDDPGDIATRSCITLGEPECDRVGPE